MVSWCFAMSWSASGQARAVVVLCPSTEAVYGDLARRLRRLGAGRVNRGLWARDAVDRVPCSVTVHGGQVTQVRLGPARLVADVPMPMEKTWLEAAFLAGWVVLGLAPVGAVPSPSPGVVKVAVVEPGALVDGLVDSGALLAGLAEVVDEPTLPPGRGARTTRL